jgi:hypothetical protein
MFIVIDVSLFVILIFAIIVLLQEGSPYDYSVYDMSDVYNNNDKE